jgi:hypothetical protein
MQRSYASKDRGRPRAPQTTGWVGQASAGGEPIGLSNLSGRTDDLAKLQTGELHARGL